MIHSKYLPPKLDAQPPPILGLISESSDVVAYMDHTLRAIAQFYIACNMEAMG
jgi:hypothetical protein